MLTIVQTRAFADWLANLKDARGRNKVLARIRNIEISQHFGDCKSIGEGVSELRINFGPGYRVYFSRRGTEVVILLGGGSKGTQARDIRAAQSMAKEL
jgi:putative addiction module killer protein